LFEAARKYTNIRYLDFYSIQDVRLEDSMYYDPWHLNRSGAGIFTEILMERIADDLRTEMKKSDKNNAVNLLYENKK